MLVLGNFNIHVDVPNDIDAVKFLDLLESLGFEQHVTKPTHIFGRTLDLFITRRTETLLGSTTRSCRYFSDHSAVCCSICIKKPAPQAKRVTYRKTKSVDLDGLKQDIAKSRLGCPSSCEDFDKFVQSYNCTLSSIIDRHAPLKSKVMRSRPQVPWYSQEIAEAKRKRRKAEQTWRKTKSIGDLLLFKRLRNQINRAQRNFYVGFVKEQGGDQRKLFRATKALLMPKDEICFPNCHDAALENDIARYFHRKILNIRNELDGIDVNQNRCGDLIDDPVFDSNLEPPRGFKE